MVRVEVIQAILYKLSSLVSQNISKGDKSLHEVLKQQKMRKANSSGVSLRTLLQQGS